MENLSVDDNIIEISKQNEKQEFLKDNNEIIKEGIFGRKKHFPFNFTNKISKHKINDCVGKIEYKNKENGKEEESSGTCFFCKLPKIDKIFIITNNHAIGQKELDTFKVIKILINDKIDKSIDLSIKRIKYTNEKMDFIIIEILESDYIDDFLFVDDLIYESNYKNKKIYGLQFPLGKELSFSDGKIEKIENGQIRHNISTNLGSSGAPIISKENHKVIGIHCGRDNQSNIGIFLKNVIDDILINNPNIQNEESEKKITKLYYKLLKKKFFYQFLVLLLIL